MLHRRRERVALITGGSRGIGAETALLLAEQGFHIILTYRQKAARAQRVLAAIERLGVSGLALPCDLTRPGELACLFARVGEWTDHLDALVLNASGGLEQERLAEDPEYPLHINCDAQVACVEAALPLLAPGSTILFVTSHWAHLYPQIKQFAGYGVVAQSKYAGEQALRSRHEEWRARGLRLLVVTGDLVEGTVTPMLLARAMPIALERHRAASGALPTVEQMARAVIRAVTDTTLVSGSTVAVGEPLSALLTRYHRDD